MELNCNTAKTIWWCLSQSLEYRAATRNVFHYRWSSKLIVNHGNSRGQSNLVSRSIRWYEAFDYNFDRVGQVLMKLRMFKCPFCPATSPCWLKGWGSELILTSRTILWLLSFSLLIQLSITSRSPIKHVDYKMSQFGISKWFVLSDQLSKTRRNSVWYKIDMRSYNQQVFDIFCFSLRKCQF